MEKHTSRSFLSIMSISSHARRSYLAVLRHTYALRRPKRGMVSNTTGRVHIHTHFGSLFLRNLKSNIHKRHEYFLLSSTNTPRSHCRFLLRLSDMSGSILVVHMSRKGAAVVREAEEACGLRGGPDMEYRASNGGP